MSSSADPKTPFEYLAAFLVNVSRFVFNNSLLSGIVVAGVIGAVVFRKKLKKILR
jgi:hypothetical protein